MELDERFGKIADEHADKCLTEAAELYHAPWPEFKNAL